MKYTHPHLGTIQSSQSFRLHGRGYSRGYLQRHPEHAEQLGFTPVEPVPPTPPSVEHVAEQKRAEIRAACDAAMSAISDAYPASEKQSWFQQLAEARAYDADSNADCPLLTIIAAERGITLADQAQRVLDKAAAYTQAVGAAVGKRQRLDDDVDAVLADDQLTDEQKIVAIQAIEW